ncbi:unnamed protein product [Calypogeia fissa]
MAPKRKASEVSDSGKSEKKQRVQSKRLAAKIGKFKGKKLPFQCFKASGVFTLKEDIVHGWEIYPKVGGLHFYFWNEQSETEVLYDSNIIGCVFWDNIDCEECRVGLALLFGDEGDEKSKICIVLSKGDMDKLDQDAVNNLAKTNRADEEEDKQDYPVAPVSPIGKLVAKYILDLIDYFQNYSVSTFRFGTKDEMKTQLYDADNLPQHIIARSCESIFESIQRRYS